MTTSRWAAIVFGAMAAVVAVVVFVRSSSTAIRPPSEVKVVVLNATETPELAAQVTQQLGVLGYQAFPPGNYKPLLEQSRIFYSEGFAPEAFALAAQFPDALVEPYEGPEGTGADVVVLLGRSFGAEELEG